MGQLIEVATPVLQRGIHYLTSPFGMRTIDGVTKMHNGVDLVSYYDNQTTIDYVVCFADGVVTYNGYNGDRGYCITINHGDFETIYQHLRYISILNVGMKVKKGWVVGLMGSTGKSTAAHIHFGVYKNGEWVDPMPYLMAEPTSSAWDWAKKNGIVGDETDPTAKTEFLDVVNMLYACP